MGGLLFLLGAYLVGVLVLPGQVKGCEAGAYLGVVAVLVLVLGVGVAEMIWRDGK